MGLADDLLAQARYLSNKEPKRPKQASLRRSISTAYYALFHLLSQEAANRVAPNSPSSLNNVVRRTLTHGDMKNASAGISGPRPHSHFVGLISNPIAPELRAVASAFVNLQGQRHVADYDLSVRISRTTARSAVATAEDAFLNWKLVRNTPDANVLLTAMLFWRNFNNR